MSLFRILLNATGLSLRAADVFLDVRPDTVMAWSSGRRRTPDTVIAELQGLLSRQMRAAQESATMIVKIVAERDEPPEQLELGLACDDHEAQTLGWPCISAHAQVLGMTIGLLPPELAHRAVIVPRGSTAASALAAEQH